MRRILPLFIFFVILLPLLSAQVSLPPWSWDQYTGTTQWRVDVTDDESDCGIGIQVTHPTITIQFNLKHAQMGDIGHGVASGIVNGNVLSIPGRSVPDGAGTSVLSPYDITFTSDCLTFTGSYTWVYSDSAGSCSGSTTLSGRIVNGCPAPTVVIPPSKPPEQTTDEQLSDAHKDLNNDFGLRKEASFLKLQNILLNDPQTAAEIQANKAKIDALEPSIEAKYKVILDADPNNFQANVGMAELKKSQGMTHEYYEYMDRAINSGQFTESMKETMEKNLAKELGFSTFPKPANSLLMRTISNQAYPWKGSLYDMDVQKESSDQNTWRDKLFFTLGLNKDVVNAIAVVK
jgi:hypothetical protein